MLNPLLKKARFGLVFALFLVLSPIIVAADTISYLHIPITYQSSANAAEGLFGTLVDSTNTTIGYGSTNSSGTMIFYGIAEGAYTLQLRPSQSSSCIGCGLYSNKDLDITLSKTDSGYNSGTDTLTFSSISLDLATRYITVQVNEGTNPEATGSTSVGAPINGIIVSAWDPGGNFAASLTGSDGKAYIAIPTDSTNNWNVSAYPTSGGYTQSSKSDIVVATSGETTVTLELVPTDSTIVINLKKDGSSYSLPADKYGSAYCSYYTQTKQYYFSASINPTESSATLSVLALNSGNYSCSIWLEGFGSSTASVSPIANQSVSADISILERNATVKVRLVDQNGELITGLTANAYTFTLPESATADYGYSAISNGSATFALIDGVTYNISVDIVNSSTNSISQLGVASKGYHLSSSGKKYLNSYAQLTVSADANLAQEVDYVLQEADATLKVIVKNGNGNPGAFAWVGAYEEITEIGKVPFFVGGTTDQNGSIDMPIKGGLNYIVSAFPQGAFSGDIIPPQAQVIKIATAEQKTITMQSFTSNHSLIITPRIQNSETSALGLPDYVDCYGRTDGISTYANSKDGQTVVLPLIAGKNWVIGCFGYSLSSYDFYYSPEQGYSASGNNGSLSVTMTTAGEYYPPQSFTFGCANTTSITLPDGISTLNVPANAIGSSGNCSITVETAKGVTANEGQYPAFALDFSAFDAQGNKVEKFNNNLTLTLYYNPDSLPAGITEDTLNGSYFDGDTFSWQSPDSVEVDTDNDRVTISLSHFSSYSITGKVGVLNAPSAVKAKADSKSCSSGTRAYKVSWSKVSGAKNYQYQTRTKSKSDGKKSVSERFAKAKSKSSSKKTASLCLKAGSYEVRVRAITSTKVPGSWSLAKSFKVK